MLDHTTFVAVVNYGESRTAIPQCPGVYLIRNNINHHIYVGSTVNLRRRWHQHSWSLDKNSHHNPHLQNAWNKYGNHSFCFIVLETVANNSLILPTEQKWIDMLDAANRRDCYNYCERAGSHLGRKRSEETRKRLAAANTGKKHTDDAKQKMRLAKLGKSLSEEHKRKVGEKSKGRPGPKPKPEQLAMYRKLNPDQVKNVRSMHQNGVTPTDIARKFGVSFSTIKRILNGESYKDIT